MNHFELLRIFSIIFTFTYTNAFAIIIYEFIFHLMIPIIKLLTEIVGVRDVHIYTMTLSNVIDRCVAYVNHCKPLLMFWFWVWNER